MNTTNKNGELVKDSTQLQREEKEQLWKKKRLEIWEKFREITNNKRRLGKLEMYHGQINRWLENMEIREELEEKLMELDKELFNLFQELEDISYRNTIKE